MSYKEKYRALGVIGMVYGRASLWSRARIVFTAVFIGYISPDDAFIRQAAGEKNRRVSALGIRSHRGKSGSYFF